MAINSLQRGIRRVAWDPIPLFGRDFIKSALATIVGRIGRRRPTVEVYGARGAEANNARLQAELQTVDVNLATDLCRIMTRYGSDKGAGRHNYTTVYHRLLGNLREQPINLFELGIGTNNPNLASTMGEAGKPGASLRGWAEFFRSGRIFGADIDEAILFSEDRIETFQCDQLRRNSIESMWAHPTLKREFDVVIEDGLHTFEANVSFLENSLHKVRKGGYYIVEDVRADDLPRWRDQLQEHCSVWHSEFSFCIVSLPWLFNTSDNILLVARRN